jgi:purine-binding chemotaxis protein CheW
MPAHRHRHDPSKTLVGFRVGDVRYAIAIGDVREICNPLAIVALPHAPAAVQGVADYRGEVIPVIDLRVRFGLPEVEPSRRIKWVVVRVDGHGGGEEMRGIEGVTTDAEGLVFVVESGAFRDLTSRLALPSRLAEGLLAGEAKVERS